LTCTHNLPPVLHFFQSLAYKLHTQTTTKKKDHELGNRPCVSSKSYTSKLQQILSNKPPNGNKFQATLAPPNHNQSTTHKLFHKCFMFCVLSPCTSCHSESNAFTTTSTFFPQTT
jgi:hypothetical protein